MGASNTKETGGSLAIKDEGITVASRAQSLNMTGSGVSASATGSDVEANIPGGGAATAAGSDKHVQYNDGGVNLGAEAAFQYDKTTNTLSVENINLLNTGFKVKDVGGSYYLTVAPGSTLTANRQLTITTGDADRTLTLSGNATLSGTNTGDQTITLSGDVSGSGTGSITATIGSNKVTNAMLATVATATFKGRTTAGTGNVEDLTSSQATALLSAFVGDSGSGGTKGLVPAPATGDSTKFLRGDGTWASVSGTGDVVGPASATDNAIVRFDSTTGKLIQNSAATIADTTGDITAGKYNTVAISGSSTPSLAVTGTTAVSGTNTGDQTSVSGNAGTATALLTPRAIYGNNFDGTAALTQVIASTYGGTGNGFTKFTGPTTSEKTFTLPNSSETLLYSGGALGTPSSGTLTNASGLPLTGLVSDTTTALGLGSINLGHASDTTIARVSAGVVSIEGVNVVTVSSTDTLTNKTLTAPKFADLGYLADANGNELIILDTVASAVNEITFSNAATGNDPNFTASGGDTNIGIKFTSKGTGKISLVGSVNHGDYNVYFTETDNGNSSTADTIDWTKSNHQKSTLTGNCTFTFTAPNGPCMLSLKLVQDATGSRTVTWPAAVHWTDGTAPTLTATASKVDIITFYYDGTTYFGAYAKNYTA